MTDKPSREDVRRIARLFGAVIDADETGIIFAQCLDTYGFAAAMYAAGAEEARRLAANSLMLTAADLRLMAGEMTVREIRTVHAVLVALERSIRALPITPTNTEG